MEREKERWGRESCWANCRSLDIFKKSIFKVCMCVLICIYMFANTLDGSSPVTSTIQGLYLDHMTDASLP